MGSKCQRERRAIRKDTRVKGGTLQHLTSHPGPCSAGPKLGPMFVYLESERPRLRLLLLLYCKEAFVSVTISFPGPCALQSYDTLRSSES